MRATSYRTKDANGGQGSNWIWRPTRLRIYVRDGWRCVWCQCEVYSPSRHAYVPSVPGRELSTACLDHVVPRERGGANKPGNLVTACLSCNSARQKRSAIEFAFELAGDIGLPARDFAAEILNRVIEAMGRELPALPKGSKAAA